MTTRIREREGVAAANVEAKQWTDRELLEACIAKDDGAWRELFRRYDGPLRGAVYKRLASCLERLPSDYRDDVMGAFYLKLVDNEMRALRCFDWQKGTALFKWLAFLVVQCATDYLIETLDAPDYAPLDDALEVADDGGVLRSGRPRFRGSLAERVRKDRAHAAAVEETREREARRRRRRATKRTAR